MNSLHVIRTCLFLLGVLYVVTSYRLCYSLIQFPHVYLQKRLSLNVGTTFLEQEGIYRRVKNYKYR